MKRVAKPVAKRVAKRGAKLVQNLVEVNGLEAGDGDFCDFGHVELTTCIELIEMNMVKYIETYILKYVEMFEMFLIMKSVTCQHFNTFF